MNFQLKIEFMCFAESMIMQIMSYFLEVMLFNLFPLFQK